MNTFIIHNYLNLCPSEIPKKIPIKNLGYAFRLMLKIPIKNITFWEQGTISTEFNVLIILFQNGTYYQTDFGCKSVFEEVFKRHRAMNNVVVTFKQSGGKTYKKVLRKS